MANTPENKLPTLREGAHDEVIDNLNTVADLEKQAIAELFESVGSLNTFNLFSRMGEIGVLTQYENIKKSKAWKFIKNPNSSHGERFLSLEEFCEVIIGKSYKRMQAILQNRNTIGEELFEQSEKLGLRQTDYNAIKALPAPKQEMVKQAIADGSTREDVVRVLCTLMEQDTAEIATLTKERDKYHKDWEAASQLAGDRLTKIGNLEEVIVDGSLAKTAWDVKYNLLIEQAQERHRHIANGFTSLEEIRKEALKPLEDMGDDIPADVAHALDMLAAQMVHIHNTCAKSLEKFGFIFDRTLGSFTDARIDLYALPTAYTGEADDTTE